VQNHQGMSKSLTIFQVVRVHQTATPAGHVTRQEDNRPLPIINALQLYRLRFFSCLVLIVLMAWPGGFFFWDIGHHLHVSNRRSWRSSVLQSDDVFLVVSVNEACQNMRYGIWDYWMWDVYMNESQGL
jgi:hypothetical protein